MKPLGSGLSAGVVVRSRALIALAIILNPLSAHAEGRLHAVRFWSGSDATRIALEADVDIEYRAERIENPDRLFFDLDGVSRPPGKRGIETIPVGDRLVKQIRVAQTTPQTIRVVLDLAGPVEYAVSRLRNPDRLIIELRYAPAPPPALGPSDGAPFKQPHVTMPKPSPAPPKAPLSEPPRLPARVDLNGPAPEVATAARRDSHGGRSLIRALGLKLERVALDPGHGGHDTGTIGPGGLEEKALVLDVAKRLGALISQRLGSEVYFTRSDDTFVPLEARAHAAREFRADLFISIHANASRSGGIAGPETYYLNFTRDADSLEVAARENAASKKSIAELQNLIEKITLKENVHESREFAETIQRSLYASVSRGRPMKNRGVKKAPFVVLAEASMPSVLVEIAFLSNPRDERMLKRPDYRQRIAEALYKGVAQYAGSLSHYPQVARGQ